MQAHLPVLEQEVLEWLAPDSGGRYLDVTLGAGGHSLAIMKKVQGKAEILGLDQDLQALYQARSRIEQAGFRQQVHLAHVRFSRFDRVLRELGWQKVHGAIMDLGVSSMQLDNAGRGFSFQQSGPLDMRMDQSQGYTARHLLQKTRYEELRRIILEYGQEPLAGKIASKIVQTRENKPIADSQELADLVSQAYPAARRRKSRNHPATKTFQALRIAVNQELQELELFLRKIPDFLLPGGKLLVISFHSLEDRLVKNACRTSPGAHGQKMRLITKKPVQPGKEEISRNPRSRSARMRVAQKICSS